MAPPGFPTRLDGYELLARVAAGGMAEVFVARSLGEARSELVAVKVLLEELCTDARFVTMFVDEANVAAHVTHPNVVAIHDVGRTARGVPFLVMDLVVGASVAQLLRGGAGEEPQALPLPLAIEIAAQAAEGLAAAHDARDGLGAPLEIVHRDVSPQNILVGIDGRARIADFGIARAAARLTQTAAGEVKGKARYFSPEQARGRPVDRRSDLFSLGVALWESLTLRPLFVGASMPDVMQAVVTAEIPDVRAFRPEAPEELARVLDWALQREPERRVPSGLELASALRWASSAAGLEARPIDLAAYARARRAAELEELIDTVERRSGLRISSPAFDPSGEFEDEATRVDADLVRRIRRSRPETGAMEQVDAAFPFPSVETLARAASARSVSKRPAPPGPRASMPSDASAPPAPVARTISDGTQGELSERVAASARRAARTLGASAPLASAASAPVAPPSAPAIAPPFAAPSTPLVVPPTRVRPVGTSAPSSSGAPSGALPEVPSLAPSPPAPPSRLEQGARGSRLSALVAAASSVTALLLALVAAASVASLRWSAGLAALTAAFALLAILTTLARRAGERGVGLRALWPALLAGAALAIAVLAAAVAYLLTLGIIAPP